MTAKGCTSGCERVSDDEAEHHKSKESHSSILLGNSEPSSDECKKLPLPGINPEHNKLWDTIVKILAKVAAGLERWAEAGWFHSHVNVRNCSEDKVGQEVSDEASDGESFGTEHLHLNALIANEWVANANGEEVGEAWGPELVEAIEESSVGITNSPEPKRWKEMNEILLSHVGILIILIHELRKHESTVHNGGKDSAEKHGP